MDSIEVLSEKVCGECGVEVRSGSEFCYNCGGKVGEGHAEETTFSHKAPGMPIPNVSESSPVRRRSSRTTPRTSGEPVQVTWRPTESPGLGLLFVSIGAAVLALVLLGIAYYLR